MPSIRQIGSQTFTLMQGLPQAPADGLEELARPGEDHASWRLIGKRGREALLRTWQLAADASAAKTACAAFVALIGTSVTVYDSLGNSHANCRVLDAQTAQKAVLVGGAVKILLTTDWRIKQSPAG